VVEVGKPKGPAFDEFDLVVDTFSKGIGPVFDEVIEYLLKPVVQSDKERIEGFHLHSLNLFYPSLERLFGFFTIGERFKL
jgi:hypothetical protein